MTPPHCCCVVCDCSYTSTPQGPVPLLPICNSTLSLSLQVFSIAVFEPVFCLLINYIMGCSCLFVFVQQGWLPPQPSSLQWHPNPRTAALPSPNHKKVSFTLTFLRAPFPSSVHHTLVSSGDPFCHAAAMWSVVFIYLSDFMKTGVLSCCSGLI